MSRLEPNMKYRAHPRRLSYLLASPGHSRDSPCLLWTLVPRRSSASCLPVQMCVVGVAWTGGICPF